MFFVWPFSAPCSASPTWSGTSSEKGQASALLSQAASHSSGALQGGIHPDFTGQDYLHILQAAKAGAPDIHVHAFSPLEVSQGAHTLGIPVLDFLQQLKAAGLGSLPGGSTSAFFYSWRAMESLTGCGLEPTLQGGLHLLAWGCRAITWLDLQTLSAPCGATSQRRKLAASHAIVSM